MSLSDKTLPPGPWEGLPTDAALKTLLTMKAVWHPEQDPIRVTQSETQESYFLSYAQAEALAPGLVQAVQDFERCFSLQANLRKMRFFYWHWLKNGWNVAFPRPGYAELRLHPVHLVKTSHVTLARSTEDFQVHVLVSSVDAGVLRWVDYDTVPLRECAPALNKVCPGWRTRFTQGLDLGLPVPELQAYVFGTPECAPTVMLPEGLDGP